MHKMRMVFLQTIVYSEYWQLFCLMLVAINFSPLCVLFQDWDPCLEMLIIPVSTPSKIVPKP